MDAKELEAYQYQLDQVRQTLVSDPDNSELRNLETELVDLIKLTKEYLQSQEPEPIKPRDKAKEASKPANKVAASTPSTLKAGDEVSARWVSGDKGWYPARITSVTGSAERPVYIVSFHGYNTTESLGNADVKTVEPKKKTIGSIIESAECKQKRKEPSTTDEPVKKKKVSASAAESMEKQKAWQSFASKGQKKKTSVINDKSIFKTPDNPYGKVGVVNSGKGMTSFKTRGRHVFDKD